MTAVNSEIVNNRDWSHVLYIAGEFWAGSLHAINYYLHLGHPLIGKEEVTRDGVIEQSLVVKRDRVLP
jgi:hypothetical protein